MAGLAPALLTRMSMRPKASLTVSTILPISSNLPRCDCTTSASPPNDAISAAVSSRSFTLRLVSATFAPALAKPTAIALPMPRLAPVTMAFFP